MGLIGRRIRGGIEGTAVILESEANPGTLTSATVSQAAFVDFNVLGSRKYRFALEVRLPGREPYRVEGIFKVPKRTENTGLLSTAQAIPAGIEVPVRVDPADTNRMEIDWDAYMAAPGRKEAQSAATTSRKHEVMRRELMKNPKLQLKLQANNRTALASWVAAVKGGAMERAELEQTIEIEVASGRMDPADAEAALRSLDA